MSKIPEGFVRVSKRRRCPVCGRPDWCLVASDGTKAICPRTLSKKHLSDELGWLHVLDETVADQPIKLERKQREEPAIDFDFLANVMRNNLTPERHMGLAQQLGVTADALDRLHVGWSVEHHSYSFPMMNAKNQTIGIRLRRPNGFKYAVTGSANGLFIPRELTGEGPLVIVEGPTDAAACLDMGFDVIGRPSCSACVAITCDIVERVRNPDWLIIEDHDDPKTRPDGSVFLPGQEGAAKLAEALRFTGKAGKIIAPREGFKDVRSWRQMGATKSVIMARRHNVKWIPAATVAELT